VSDIATWRTVTGQDAHSTLIDPLFVNAGGSAAVDYMLQRNLQGETNVAVTSDFGNLISRVVPNIGAWERNINLWTGATSSAYSNSANWSKGTIPSASDNIVFSATPTNDCTLETDLTVANLYIESTGKIIIPTTKMLTVSTKIITDNNPSRIHIQASNDGSAANGSLIFYNTAQFPVYATVEMYNKASIVNPAGSTTNSGNYRWQFFSIPVASLRAEPTFNGSYVRRWNNPDSKWVIQRNDSIILPFKGYEIAQIAPKKMSFAGALLNSNFTTTLSYNAAITFPGHFIFSNPYTAAVEISELTYGDGIENSVYLFNTGSSADWTANLGSNLPSSLPGQYVVCPKMTSGTGSIPGEIASMQGFLVKDLATGGSDNTFGIPYSAVLKNSAPQRTKRQSESVADRVLTTIDVKGTNYADRMWIITNPTCTHDFDNGWDGRKILGSALTPQLFALEADGNYQVNAVDNIHNTNLAFQTGEASSYTLTFTHQNIENAYSTLYLIDLDENITTDISASGTEYKFLSTPTSTPELRFKIVTATGGITKNATLTPGGLKLVMVQNKVIVHNTGNVQGKLSIYDTNGRIVQESKFEALGLTTINLNLPDGYYVAKAKTHDMEVTEKVIVNKLVQ